VRKGIVLAAVFAMGGLAFLAGCGNQGKEAGIPVGPKWKGAPYRIAFDTAAPKPNPAGLSIPIIKFTANPDALETRATLIVRFDSSGVKRAQAAQDQPSMDQMVMAPVDVSGADGALPADYMDATDKELAKLLGAYCIKGKVKLSVALAKSSLSPQPGDAELDNKRLSDWLPIELPFKNPHPKC
jgi:hypothetical protein